MPNQDSYRKIPEQYQKEVKNDIVKNLTRVKVYGSKGKIFLREGVPKV